LTVHLDPVRHFNYFKQQRNPCRYPMLGLAFLASPNERAGRSDMKIVIPDDYQDMVHQLECFSLISGHDVTRYRKPARDLSELVERLGDAEVVVSIRERVEFSRALVERLPKLKLIALVGRNSKMIDFAACIELDCGRDWKSNSPVAPAELTLAPIAASRRNVAPRPNA
jgi:D-3-phosphoglycerate dehydrogenase